MPQSAANFLGGATSGCLSTLLLQPLDVVKTRLQISPYRLGKATDVVNHSSQYATSGSSAIFRSRSVRYPGIYETVLRIIRDDSFLGLWRGVTPTIIRNTLGVGAYFVTLNNISTFLARPDGTMSDSATLFAGATSRSLAVLALCPLSVVKTRLELAEYSSRYSGLFDALRKISQREGLRGLFSGLTPAIVRDAPYSALYLLFFLRTKEAMNRAIGLKSNTSNIIETNPISTPNMQTNEYKGSPRSLPARESVATESGRYDRDLTDAKSEIHHTKTMGMAVNFVAGAIGGGLATLFTQPQDVIKTRIQAVSGADMPFLSSSYSENSAFASSNTVVATIRRIFAEEGIHGFFRGAHPRFLKRMLGSAITWMVYEEMVRVYDRYLTARSLRPGQLIGNDQKDEKTAKGSLR